MKLIFALLFITCSITAISSSLIDKELDGAKIHCLNSVNDPLQDPLVYKKVREKIESLGDNSVCLIFMNLNKVRK